MKQSDDQTLFAWQLGFETLKDDICGPLASHPSKFREAGSLLPIPDSESLTPYSMTNKGLRIDLPIVHQDDHQYGIAILHCSTTESFPQQIGLPVIRLGPPGSNQYARDARYIGPLGSIELDFHGSRTIFMKQQPEQSVGWRTGLLVRIPIGQKAFFRPTCWTADVTALKDVDEETDARAEYLIPSNCRRGAILFSGQDQSHLLVLFNIEMQHIERFACKAMYSPPSTQRQKYPLTPSQKSIQDVADIVQNAPNYNGSHRSDAAYTSLVFAQQVAKEASWTLMHTDHSPSHSRRSFDYLPHGRAVYANIGLQTVRGQNALVLDVEIQDRLEGHSAPYELEGISIPSTVPDTDPTIDEIENHNILPLPKKDKRWRFTKQKSRPSSR